MVRHPLRDRFGSWGWHYSCGSTLRRPGPGQGGARVWAGLSGVGLVLVLAGAVADPSIRVWLWILVIAADIVAAAIAGRAQDWDLKDRKSVV